MADIPQEVREAAAKLAAVSELRPILLSGEADDHPYIEVCHAMFLAGKRAGAEEEKRHQDFITATAHECGHKAGMERAAEIAYRTCAETRHVSLGDKCTQAIRSEADGHG